MKKQPNFYFNKSKLLLIILNDNLQPVGGYGGNLALKKYRELTAKQPAKPSGTDLRNEIELCKLVLLNSVEMPPEIRSDYQRRYRTAKKQLEQLENELIKI